MFKCKVCAEKDKRIEDLQYTVKFLKNMLNPNYSMGMSIEANKILDGGSMPVIEVNADPELTPEQARRLEEVRLEETRILTGNY